MQMVTPCPHHAYAMGSSLLDLVVSVDLVHPAPEQLTIVLESPGGAVIDLWDREAGPLPESFVIEGVSSLASVNGYWTLRVVDTVEGTTGRWGPLTLWLTSDRS